MMDFSLETPMNMITQRYSLSSHSSELGTIEMNSEQLSMYGEGKSPNVECREQKGLQRRNTATPTPLNLDPFITNPSNGPFSNMLGTSSDSWMSEKSMSSSVKMRSVSESLDDFPSPMERNSEGVNLSSSTVVCTQKSGSTNNDLMELMPGDFELVKCLSPSLPADPFNSSSGFRSISNPLDKLEESGQSDRKELSSGCADNRSGREISSPQLVSSEEVIFPIPCVNSGTLDGGGTKNRFQGELRRKKERNLVNSPIQGDIRAKILGNKYALIDDDSPEKEKIIQSQLEAFYKKVVEGGLHEVRAS